LIIEGVNVKKKIPVFGSNELKNGIVSTNDFREQSLNYCIQLNADEPSRQRTYRFDIKRLPTPVIPGRQNVTYGKNKITIELTKRANETWQPYVDSEFETIHLVKN
jgi:hypothetical protein